MKTSAFLTIATLSGCAAFAPSAHRAGTTQLAASEAPPMEDKSISLPFLERPKFLDGNLAGDAGFDPLNFARGEKELLCYREAELKHSRLAMLAAAGWPISELLDKKIAGALNLDPLLDANDRVPSFLNGGLGSVSPIYWAVILGVAAVVDFNGTNRATFEAPGYFPGNLGFDPLGLYPENEDEQKAMRTAEIKHGRVAMMAVVGYAIQEFVFKTGVVDETPFFFTPIWG